MNGGGDGASSKNREIFLNETFVLIKLHNIILNTAGFLI